MTLYYYMYRSWQDCCRRGENRSWPSVSVESVDSEYWYLNNAIVYAFIMRLTVEERVLRSTFKSNTLYFPVLIMCLLFLLWIRYNPASTKTIKFCVKMYVTFFKVTLNVTTSHCSEILWCNFCVLHTLSNSLTFRWPCIVINSYNKNN